jgi:ADP-ribose pyrophosphatase YjhB (NUDIX family)
MECSVHRLVADVAVLCEDQVLMVRYRDTARYDGQQGWFLPDDLLLHIEHPSEAAGRILREQVGLRGEPLLHHIESFGNGWWHLAFHHVLRLHGAPTLTAGANVLEAAWFEFGALPDAAEVAHHGWGLEIVRAILDAG